MSPFVRIARVRGLLLRRWVTEHAFVLFVLGPILVGAALWTGERQLVALRAPLAARLAAESVLVASEPQWAVGLTLALVSTLLLWPGTLAETFGGRRPGEDLLDALPVPEAQRAASIVLLTLARAVPAAALFVGAAAVLRTANAAPPDWLAWAGQSLAAFATLASLCLLLAVLLARLGWLSGPRLALVGGIGAVVAAVPMLRPVLLPWQAAATRLDAVLRQALEVEPVASASSGFSSPWLAPTQSLVVFAVAGALLAGWRRRDLEAASRLLRRRRAWTLAPLPRLVAAPIERRLGAAVTAGLRRDLRIVFRLGTTAVPLAVAVSVVVWAVPVRLVTDGTLTEAWRAEALVAGAVLAVLAATSIVPFLLAGQLPQFWIERTTGVRPEQVWWTKALLAALLALPPLALGLATVAWLLPISSSWLAALQLLAGATMVAGAVGASVFEIAEEPHLGLLFAGFVGVALASLFLLYPAAWFLWVPAAAWALGKMVERGARRVRFTEVPR